MMQDLQRTSAGESTSDIAHLLGMLDPWYERNTLSLLDLPANIVCKVQVYLYVQHFNVEQTHRSLNSATFPLFLCYSCKY